MGNLWGSVEGMTLAHICIVNHFKTCSVKTMSVKTFGRVDVSGHLS